MTDPRDARPPINAIRAIVRIQTPPEFDPRTGQVRPGELISFDTSGKDIGRDLLSVTTSKKLSEPCGRFTLTMVPREVLRGSTWADLIPPYSLVEIYLQSYPRDPQPVLVMLGLTDTNQVTEEFGDAAPQRRVQIAGRELSCVFVDQKTLYLPLSPDLLEPELVSAQPGMPALFTPQAALFGMLAIDPELAEIGASPIDVIDRFIRMVTVGLKTQYNPAGRPLLNLQLPIEIDAATGKPTTTLLRDLLVFNPASSAERLFDQRALLPPTSQLIDTGTSLWNLMSTFSDPTYQELFTTTVDLRLSSTQAQQAPLPRTRLVASEVIFRSKPFGGRIDLNGDLVGTRAETGSQFDADFENDSRWNFAVSDGDVVGSSAMRTAQRAVNLFYVFPQTLAVNKPEDFRQYFRPLLDAGDHSPASAQRLGPRLMNVSDYYFTDPGTNVGTDVQIATTRARLLWNWHRFEPLFWRGQYRLRGTPRAGVGMRMVDFRQRSAREFYVVGVTHSMNIGGQQPHYSTQLDVERGWPLSA